MSERRVEHQRANIEGRVMPGSEIATSFPPVPA